MNTLHLEDFVSLLSPEQIQESKELTTNVFGGGGVTPAQSQPEID